MPNIQNPPTLKEVPIGIEASGNRSEFDSMGHVDVQANRYWAVPDPTLAPALLDRRRSYCPRRCIRPMESSRKQRRWPTPKQINSRNGRSTLSYAPRMRRSPAN